MIIINFVKNIHNNYKKIMFIYKNEIQKNLFKKMKIKK